MYVGQMMYKELTGDLLTFTKRPIVRGSHQSLLCCCSYVSGVLCLQLPAELYEGVAVLELLVALVRHGLVHGLFTFEGVNTDRWSKTCLRKSTPQLLNLHI